MTENLSAIVESLLTDFITKERAKRAAQDEALKQAIASWNAVSEKHGSFAEQRSEWRNSTFIETADGAAQLFLML
jgi:post-segregation antitoxin (ccd killing protein)